jgi:hypothetical protein
VRTVKFNNKVASMNEEDVRIETIERETPELERRGYTSTMR